MHPPDAPDLEPVYAHDDLEDSPLWQAHQRRLQRKREENKDVHRFLWTLSERQRRRFDGMTYFAIKRDPRYRSIRRNASRPAGEQVAHGARQQSGRPRAQAARSSARSGDGPSDSDPHEEPPRLSLTRRRGVYSYGLAGYRQAVAR